MRGHLGPACNAVGYVDREVWGINHLYSQPVWIRLKVWKHKNSLATNVKRCSTVIKSSLTFSRFYKLQACTLASPEAGDLRPDAPTWCRAPFEPEGLLR